MQTNANDNTKKLQSGHWREGLGGQKHSLIFQRAHSRWIPRTQGSERLSSDFHRHAQVCMCLHTHRTSTN